MTYTSFTYFAFLVVLVIVYFAIPRKAQWVVLLVGSYLFYIFAAGTGTIVYLIVTTISVFLTALGVSKQKTKARKKGVMAIGLLINFGILGVLKYSGFVIINVNTVFHLGFGAPSFLLPLGISFYTFQTAGYLIDVYRGKYAPDTNIFKFALFTSFFPQIVQGPISRHDQLAHQLYASHDFNWLRFKYGLELMLWGLFKKLVIADRAAVFVQYTINNSDQLAGSQIAAGCLMYMIQIYGDFSGGIDISRGVCLVLGIEMTENFRRPYFSTSLTDFWRRWHITLGAWMREYIFYPLVLSPGFGKVGKWTRKHIGPYWGRTLPAMIATGITFLVVGIWHGAAWKFVCYGAYNAVILMFETAFVPKISDWNKKVGFINTKTFSWHFLSILVTLFILFIGRFFSFSYGADQAVSMIKSVFLSFHPSLLFNGSLYQMGLSEYSFNLLMVAVIVLFVVSLSQELGVKMREALERQNIVFRWIIYLVAVFTILIFGVYGPNVDPSMFIYQQF